MIFQVKIKEDKSRRVFHQIIDIFRPPFECSNQDSENAKTSLLSCLHISGIHKEFDFMNTRFFYFDTVFMLGAGFRLLLLLCRFWLGQILDRDTFSGIGDDIQPA